MHVKPLINKASAKATVKGPLLHGSCEANEPIGPSAPGNVLIRPQRRWKLRLGEQVDHSHDATKGNSSKVEPPRWRFTAQVSPSLLTSQLFKNPAKPARYTQSHL
jgi:hypothetical protein